jgi:replicative DNA helicase
MTTQATETMERSILGAIIQDVEHGDTAAELGVAAADFTVESCRVVYRAVERLRADQKPVDIVGLEETIGTDLERIGGAGYLYSVVTADLISTVNARNWMESLLAASRQRSLQELFAELPMMDVADPDTAVADVRRRLESFEQGSRDLSKTRRMIDELPSFIGYMVKPYELGNTFAPLNAADYSLIRDGLITIGAEANAGKSSILTALALDILRHNRRTAFLYYTLDDAAPLSAKRILSQVTGFNQFGGTFDDSTLSPGDRDLLSRIVLKDKLNLAQLKRDARRVKTICGAESIIIGVDYLQIIPNNTDAIQREFLNGVVKELKEAQKALDPGCTMFLLSQLNRDVKSGGFRYRETSEIENQSDVCFDLKGDESDRESPERKITVVKNKLGRKGRTWSTSIDGAFLFDQLYTLDGLKNGNGRISPKMESSDPAAWSAR